MNCFPLIAFVFSVSELWLNITLCKLAMTNVGLIIKDVAHCIAAPSAMISGHCYSLFRLKNTQSKDFSVTQTFEIAFILHQVSMCLLTYMYMLTLLFA
jgi:hypothetical protein